MWLALHPSFQVMSWFRRMDTGSSETGEDQLDSDVMDQVDIFKSRVKLRPSLKDILQYTEIVYFLFNALT